MDTPAVEAQHVARVRTYVTLDSELIDFRTPYAKITCTGDQIEVELSKAPQLSLKQDNDRRKEWHQGTYVGRSWTWRMVGTPTNPPRHGYYRVSKQGTRLILTPLRGWPVTWRYLPYQGDTHLLIPSATRAVFHPARWDIGIHDSVLVIYPHDDGPYRRPLIRIPAAYEGFLPPGRWWLFGVLHEGLWAWNKMLSGLITKNP